MMPAKNLMKMVFSNTARSPRHFILSAFGIVIGIGAFVLFLALTQKAGERTAKVLPNVDKGFTTDYSRDVDILEAAVSRSADRTLAGKVRNNTDHIVRSTDIVFDVTDEEGSQLGGVAVRIENLAPKSIAPFKIALEQREATAAMVREVHSR